MRLTVIGCSGSFPGPDSPASCYLLEAEHGGRPYRLVLDMGNGSLGALQRHLDPREIDAVALSHLHVDHCIDLCSLYVLLKYHPGGETPRIPVYGPEGTARRLAAGYDMPPEPGMSNELSFHAWTEGEPVDLGPFEVTPLPVVHPVPAFALRVRCGETTLVYSGDTGPTDALVEAAKGADVLLAEASFVESADNPADLHLTGREAAEHASRAQVQRLLLTHVPPWIDRSEVLAEARPAFDGPLELVTSGRTYEL